LSISRTLSFSLIHRSKQTSPRKWWTRQGKRWLLRQ
jgi:hypothetical protein